MYQKVDFQMYSVVISSKHYVEDRQNGTEKEDIYYAVQF